MGERPVINVVNDQFGCPTYAADLADAIMKIVNADNNNLGIINYSNSGITTWYQFAVAIKEFIKSPCEVRAIPTSQFPTPARRPMYSVLDTSKIAMALHIEIPNWKSSLHKCLKLLN